MKNAIELQRELMNKYVGLGWKLHKWFDKNGRWLKNHLTFVEQFIPNKLGFMPAEIKNIFDRTENDIGLDWAKNKFIEVKKKFGDLTEKEYRKMTDLSKLDCAGSIPQEEVQFDEKQSKCNKKELKEAAQILQSFCEKKYNEVIEDVNISQGEIQLDKDKNLLNEVLQFCIEFADTLENGAEETIDISEVPTNTNTNIMQSRAAIPIGATPGDWRPVNPAEKTDISNTVIGSGCNYKCCEKGQK